MPSYRCPKKSSTASKYHASFHCPTILLWEKQDRLGQTRFSGLHLDSHQPRPPEGVAPYHRQVGRPNLPLRTPVPGWRPCRVPLHHPRGSKRPPPPGGENLGKPGRPSLGYGGRRKWKGAGENRRHGGLLPGGILVLQDTKRRGRGGTGLKGGGSK